MTRERAANEDRPRWSVPTRVILLLVALWDVDSATRSKINAKGRLLIHIRPVSGRRTATPRACGTRAGSRLPYRVSQKDRR